MAKSKSSVGKKLGRPPRDRIYYLRTMFWYWTVRKKSGLKDGKLDNEFSDKGPDGTKRKYEDRIRIFEDIRKTGCAISKGHHKKRKFNLIDRVNSHQDLDGSKAIYESALWDVVSERASTFVSTRDQLIKMSSLYELNQLKFNEFIEPSSDEMDELATLTGFKQNNLKTLLENDIETDFRNLYDSVFDSFGSIMKFVKLYESLDLDLLGRYFNQLAFSILFYRYALFTGNFHAVVSAADFVRGNLSFFTLGKIVWIDQSISNEFFHLIYTRVFLKPNHISNNHYLLETKIRQSHTVNKGSSLETLLALLDEHSLSS